MEITKEQLEKIYYENSNQKAAKKLNMSNATLIKYVKEAGIKPKGRGKKSKLKIVN